VTTLLLTIAGPGHSADVAVPGDLPLDKLIPPLLETEFVDLVGSEPREWVLTLPGGEPLETGRSLIECGVVDGQLLRLRLASAQPDETPAVSVVAQPVLTGSPLTRARQALPSGSTAREHLIGDRGRYVARLEARIRDVPLRGCVTIAVVSSKGGVGKSTVSVLLGSLLARVRGDGVIAVDADSDYGSLGPWLAPEHAVSVNELAAALEQPGYLPGKLEDHMALGPEGLRICSAPRDPTAMAALDRERYLGLLAELQEQASILILDCGTGLGQPGVQAAILASDQLVVVSDGAPATLRQVAVAGGLLRHTGLPITVVVNRTSRRDIGDTAAEALFPYASALLTISDEAAAASKLSANEFSWERAARSWQREIRELAAVLATAWPQLRHTQSNAGPKP
jgi:MinD-like ATPase involved in chromosome partitioning or flagellar assembly